MLYFEIMMFTLVLILIIRTFVRYSPKLDLVVSKNTYILLLWYNKYDWMGNCTRTYIKLFEV